MKHYLERLFNEAANELPYLKNIKITFSVPQNSEHGDYSTNAAMLLTKELRMNPRQIAQTIIDGLKYDKSIIEKVEIAGPGFINFFFTKDSLVKIVSEIIDKREEFGRTKKHAGKKANVEFVSANPTGPLTVGHGRNAVIGDTVANMLEWIGYEVDREYYFNNAGRQMRVLGDSVKKRYLQIVGEHIEFPEDYYQGEYISEIAQKLFDEHGDSLKDESESGIFKQVAEKEIFADIEKTLNRIGIKIKIFFNEHSLYENGKIDDLLKELDNKNLTYEKDGARWFKLTELGKEQDKVIVKSTGEPTYRLPDIAYHVNKFERNYDLIIDLFGSDHAATYPDVLAGVSALGNDINKVKVLIHQFVTIMQGGEAVKMSTRKANFITLDELIDWVGKDVVRYFFIMRSIGSHLNFDLDIAKKQSDENPVFYLQYAHARISSILRMTEEENINFSLENLELLTTESEQNLLKKLHTYQNDFEFAIENLEPHRISNYLEELAALFHKFYTECRIIGSEQKLAEARISLVIAVKIILRNGLSLLGLSAPERM
jgi:arginyl-tRNA synthetase